MMTNKEIEKAIRECSIKRELAIKRGDAKAQLICELAMTHLSWKLQRRKERGMAMPGNGAMEG